MVVGVPNVIAEQTSVVRVGHHICHVSGGAEDWDEPAETPNDGLLTGPDRAASGSRQSRVRSRRPTNTEGDCRAGRRAMTAANE
jgi:hypothetical protein